MHRNPYGPEVRDTLSRSGSYYRKVLKDKALEEGEEYEYILIELTEHVESVPHSTPQRGEVPAVATLIEHVKKLHIEDMKQILSTVSYEMKVALRSTSKSTGASLAPAHGV